MPVDLGRVASKALEAAVEDGKPRRRGSTVRAMAAGAALAVAARATVSKMPGLVHLPGISALRDLPDRVRDRLADAGWADGGPDVDDEELLDEDDDLVGEAAWTGALDVAPRCCRY